MRKNQKGVFVIGALLFQIAFGLVGVTALAALPARQALKAKLTDKCVADRGIDRATCKAEVDQMTQRERVALNTR